MTTVMVHFRDFFAPSSLLSVGNFTAAADTSFSYFTSQQMAKIILFPENFIKLEGEVTEGPITSNSDWVSWVKDYYFGIWRTMSIFFFFFNNDKNLISTQPPHFFPSY